jgi:hypothetical protein
MATTFKELLGVSFGVTAAGTGIVATLLRMASGVSPDTMHSVALILR